MRDRCKILGEWMSKNWSIDVILDQARSKASLAELKGLNEFFDCLKVKGYFETQPRFCPNKLLNLFRLYQIIDSLEYRKVSLELGYSFASNKYYADKINVTIRTVQVYLAELEKIGFIEREVFTNMCMQGNYHSFRKMRTKHVNQIKHTKVVNKPVKIKVIFKNKKHLLPIKERFHFFRSLYRKVQEKSSVAYKNPYKNPYFLEYYHPFGVNKTTLLKCSTNKTAKDLEGNLSALAYMYPVIKAKEKISWLTFPSYY